MKGEYVVLLSFCWSYVLLPHLCSAVSNEAAFDKILEVNERVARLGNRLFSLMDMRIPNNVIVREGLKNSAIRDRTGLWPGGVIPYVISYSLRKREEHMKVLKSAMEEWENKTCIRFKKRENEADYVEFVHGEGCNSDVGRTSGRQSTSLGHGCADHGIVVHEIGHLVGFWHEQNRPDRDKYVEIKFNNILRKFRFAFQKYNEYKIDSLGVEYDYASVMHYGSKAFSRNSKDTIVSRNKTVTKFGNNNLSRLDVIQANRLYECNKRKKAQKNYPKFPEDFMWIPDGSSSLFDCVKINEPSDKFYWDDNHFCVRKGKKELGMKWSSRGPLRGMNCIQINEPAKRRHLSWNNNYFCVPKDSPLVFRWSYNGRIPYMDCIEWREPSDYFFRDNFLCAKPSKRVLKVDGKWSDWTAWQPCGVECGGGSQKRSRTCTNPSPRNGGRQCSGQTQEARFCNTHACPSWPAWPDDFSFISTITPSDSQCTRVYERRDFVPWRRSQFCAKNKDRRSAGLRWSDEGKVPSMTCWKIYEPQEPPGLTWNDNYLCLPKEAPYRFVWSYRGPLPGLKCIQWYAKGGKNGWNNNYLCSLTYRPDKKRFIIDDVSKWSAWSKWTECSLDCGGGTQKRTRRCIKSKAGKECVGSSIEERFCNVEKCEPCGDHFWHKTGRFKTPGFPRRYPKRTTCTWTISTPIEKRIRMRFSVFDLPGDGLNCVNDTLIIRDGSTSSSPLLGKFCGRRAPPIINSRTSSLWIQVKTTRSSSHKGLEGEWTTFLAPTPTPTLGHGCGGFLTSDSGRFATPNFPSPYPPGRTCIWIIQVDPEKTVDLVFRNFNLEPHARCGYDHVAIRDGATETSPTLGIYCGNKGPPKLTSFGNSFWIKFRSDSSTAGRGFEAFYMAKAPEKVQAKTKKRVKACPKGWTEHAEGKDVFCYAVRRRFMNWYDAQKDCKVLGANLLSLRSESEQKFVLNELLADTYLWLGFTDKAREGVWAWSDKSTNGRYQNWGGGDPNNGGYYGNEDCAVMKPDGKWNDYPCKQRFKYICKRDALLGDGQYLKGFSQGKKIGSN